MNLPVIEIEGLTLEPGGHRILSGFDLTLQQGEKVSLKGRSGSGKTTLLRCLLGFVVPSQGEIRIFGQPLQGPSVWSLRTRMAYVGQEPEIAQGRIRDILARPFSFRNNRHLRPNLERIPELLERLYLPPTLLDSEVSLLSGGEKQRIALLQALLLDREILLLDEASSALDQSARDAVIALLQAREGLTILSVSHDQEWLGFSDRVIDLASVSCGSST